MNQYPGNQETENQTGKMTLAEFEERMQSVEFFEPGTGQISDDPRLQEFLRENPDSAALVRDLQYIAVAAAELFKADHDVEPSDLVWKKIQTELGSTLDEPGGLAAAPKRAE
jgi:hypothetical protein